MKVLVSYYSETGNTRKVAEAIYGAIDKKDKDLKPMHEVESFEGYDLIFCGFPVNAHSVPVLAQDFLRKIRPGAKVALFSTHGAQKDGRMSREAIQNAVSLVRSEVIGSFACRGEVEQSVIDDLIDKPEHRGWALEAQSAKAHPDGADLEEARFFTENIIRKVIGFKKYDKR